MDSASLNQLPFFATDPVVRLEPLTGLSHRNWRAITTAKQAFFVREYQAKPLQLSRYKELKCQLRAAAAGFAPVPLYYDAGKGILITQFLERATHFQYSPECVAPLVTALAAFHQFPVKTAQLDSLLYLQQLKAAIAPAVFFDEVLFCQLQQAAAAHAALEQDMVLCHRDLTTENILSEQQQLYFIDFEYVCRADASFDLATLCLHNQLSQHEETELLQNYRAVRGLGGNTDVSMRKLQLAKIIYSGWCWLWYLMMPGYTAKADHWRQQLQQQLLLYFP
ncbi:phosphotransferase [Chromatiaceae bacterium AAb-1]|nr:phosphotransferase [Chromatiaceae bacterium AAb-1]